MRYINLDKAIEKIRQEGILGDGYSATERENDVIDMLESLPIHAYKINITTVEDWVPYYKCSVCGYDGLFQEDNYCSNCGVKFDD